MSKTIIVIAILTFVSDIQGHNFVYQWSEWAELTACVRHCTSPAGTQTLARQCEQCGRTGTCIPKHVNHCHGRSSQVVSCYLAVECNGPGLYTGQWTAWESVERFCPPEKEPCRGVETSLRRKCRPSPKSANDEVLCPGERTRIVKCPCTSKAEHHRANPSHTEFSQKDSQSNQTPKLRQQGVPRHQWLHSTHKQPSLDYIDHRDFDSKRIQSSNGLHHHSQTDWPEMTGSELIEGQLSDLDDYVNNLGSVDTVSQPQGPQNDQGSNIGKSSTPDHSHNIASGYDPHVEINFSGMNGPAAQPKLPGINLVLVQPDSGNNNLNIQPGVHGNNFPDIQSTLFESNFPGIPSDISGEIHQEIHPDSFPVINPDVQFRTTAGSHLDILPPSSEGNQPDVQSVISDLPNIPSHTSGEDSAEVNATGLSNTNTTLKAGSREKPSSRHIIILILYIMMMVLLIVAVGIEYKTSKLPTCTKINMSDHNGAAENLTALDENTTTDDKVAKDTPSHCIRRIGVSSVPDLSIRKPGNYNSSLHKNGVSSTPELVKKPSRHIKQIPQYETFTSPTESSQKGKVVDVQHLITHHRLQRRASDLPGSLIGNLLVSKGGDKVNYMDNK